MNDENVAQAEMPRYKGHHAVWALKIKEVRQSPKSVVFEGGSWELVPELEAYAPITVGHNFILGQQPKAGDYYVCYTGGHICCLPSSAFEQAYTPV